MRLNEDQFNILAIKAKEKFVRRGYLYKKAGKKQASDSQAIRLQKRWYVLYYNLLFYYEHDTSPKALGVIMVEGCVCRKSPDTKVFAFIIDSEVGDHRQYFFVASTAEDRAGWMEAIQEWSGDGLKLKNDEMKSVIKGLESQIVKEKEAKERLQRECADQWSQVARLKAEVSGLRDKTMVYRRNSGRNSDSSRDSSRDSANSGAGTYGTNATPFDEDVLAQYTPEDRKKIVQLQCAIRGWLVRKRFLRLINVYILSPEGDQLVKRNRLIWQFVISEDDYVQQLSTLIKIFYRPLSMAADSKFPACSNLEVRQIFSNSDVILMLHKMFLEGIKQRLRYWPDVKLEDYLSAMVSLLPVYHEYIRNHSAALQVLSQCKQRHQFMKLLNWYESKPECNGQTIEQFLHYPIGLLPTYARVVRELEEATPETETIKIALQALLDKLETLHSSLHVHLSESESIKHTLEIERMIDDGCDVLLDTSQKFIRDGILRHYVTSKVVCGILREKTRHCFLFSRHLIITSRTADGTFRLARICGKIPLKYTTLIEEVDDESVPQSSRHLAFTLLVKSKTECFFVTLMAARPTDKAIWTSDISQCIYNLSLEDPEEYSDDDIDGEDKPQDEVAQINAKEATRRNSSVYFRTSSIKDDPRLVTDAEDIKYAERIESNNFPQILYASIDRLIERLVDPRLPGTDFMDTFLVTYRYFTNGKHVLQALIAFYHHLEEDRTGTNKQLENGHDGDANNNTGERKISLTRSASSPAGRDRTGSIMSTSSSVSSYDDYDTLSPLTANDVINFTTLTRRHSRQQWRENPLAGENKSSNDNRPRSVSDECESTSDKPEVENRIRRKTTPAGFMNIGYQGTLNRDGNKVPSGRPFSSVEEVQEEDSPKSENGKGGNLSRATSEQSVSSICSDEISDRQLGPLIEAAHEGNQAGSYRESRPDDFVKDAVESDVEDAMHEELQDGVQNEGQGGLQNEGQSKIQIRATIITQEGVQSEVQDKGRTESKTRIQSGSLIGAQDGIQIAIPEEPVAQEHERGIDVEVPNVNTIPYDIKTLHVDHRQKQLIRQHMHEHRPSLPALLPSKTQGKDLSKWLGMTDGPGNSSTHRKKGNKKDNKKLQEPKMSRSPSTSSSNDSQTEERRSMFYDDDDLGDKPPTPTSVRKTIRQAITSMSKSKTPESPKKKIFSFRNKSQKSHGMKRSKSDVLHPGLGAFDDHEISRRSTSSLGRKSFIGEEDTHSLYSIASYEDLSIKESHSDGNLKDKGSPKTKKGKHVTLKLYDNPKDVEDKKPRTNSQNFTRDEGRVSMRAILPNRAPLKILNIMKHWVSKHNGDFEKDSELAQILRDFFRDVKNNEESLPVVKEIVKSMERLMETSRQSISNMVEDVLMREETNQVSIPEELPTNWTANGIADNLSLLEHYLYGKISTREFMKCAWTKKDKEITAPYITKISRRFNQVSGMVAYEVIHGETQEMRAQRIGFWIAVAARCRDLNNFNSVLQITSGLMKSSVYRLKKSWELVNRQLREILNDLQTLVSADHCFAKLREAIHNCNPPCVPFIGFYLTDLLFMDERSPNTNDTGLINFAKMSKISRAIREIRQYQQLRYTMDLDQDMAQYLLASHIDVDGPDFEDELYDLSLLAEPRG